MSSPPPKHSLSSPTSGNATHPLVLPTPSSSTSVSLRQQGNNNRLALLKQELEQQVEEKQRQINESSSGIGKNVLARQVSQLQERLKEIDNTLVVPVASTTSPTSSVAAISGEPLTTSSVDRIRDLSNYRTPSSISSMRNKEKLLNTRPNGLDPLPSPSASTLLPPVHGQDSTSLLPLPPPPTGSTPTKRRSKIPNTDRRNTDIEFATEIGQGLLLEVRKMQALLQEKEEKLRTLEDQKADLERAAEAMSKQMRQREENEEKLKEETWNLELAKQELKISVTDLQQNLNKANAEQSKLAKQVNELRLDIEQLRGSEEKRKIQIDNMKQRHEQDISTVRKRATTVEHEKQDQVKQIESLTLELAIAKAQSRIRKSALTDTESNSNPRDPLDSQDEGVNDTNKNDNNNMPSSLSSQKQSTVPHQDIEIETLKTSMAHAHKIISGLRSKLHREKCEKTEFKKLLEESQETIEHLKNNTELWVDIGPTRHANHPSSTNRDISNRKKHKASSIKQRRGTMKSGGTNRRQKPKEALGGNGEDSSSVYSYSSMSDSEEIDSNEESDVETAVNKSKENDILIGYTTPLSLKSSRNNLSQDPISADTDTNTKQQPVRSLGDELSAAMSRESSQHEPVSSFKDIAGGLVAGAAGTLGLSSLVKESGTDISTQTDEIQENVLTIPGTEMSTQTDTVAVEPTVPVIAEIFTQTESISATDTSVQTEVNPLTSVSLSSFAQEPSPSSIQQQPILETFFQPTYDIPPEDPTIAAGMAAAATAAAIAASRSAALDAATHTFTQSDPVETVDQSIQSEPLLTKDSATQNYVETIDQSTQHVYDMVECGVQSDNIITPVAVDAYMQSDSFETKDVSVQHDENNLATDAAAAAAAAAGILASKIAYENSISIGIQSELPVYVDHETQYDLVEQFDHETQHDVALGVDRSTQPKPIEATETGVQSETPVTVDADVQHQHAKIIETKDVGVQYEQDIVKENNAMGAIIPVPVSAKSNRSTALSDGDDEEFFDASSKPSSRNTVTSDVAFPAFAAVDKSSLASESVTAISDAQSGVKKEPSANTVRSADENKQTQNNAVDELKNMPVTCKENHMNATDTANVAIAASAAAAAISAVSNHTNNKTVNTSDKDNVVLEDTSAERQNASSFATSAKNIQPNTAHTATDGDSLSPVVEAEQKDINTGQQAARNVYENMHPQEEQHLAEKMFTKTEMDALIAAAVASALTKAALATNTKADEAFDNSDNTKPPALDTSHIQDADSAAISPSSGISSSDRYDDEDDMLNGNYGDVVVHLPREEDTITPAYPYQEKRPLQEYGAKLDHVFNQSLQQPPQPQKSPVVLSQGPSTFFAKAPSKREITEADVPVRPPNPAPPALLSRAISPAFTESRSLSPSSLRSGSHKGKAPMDFSDIESAPSHEDFHRAAAAAALQQAHPHRGLKRASVSTSSFSTNNEQLQSVNSSQYNGSMTRSTAAAAAAAAAATDPNMINMITQTMIGDWMWKYTRKAVGGGISENKHQRYFWIHPYTRTLYWSTNAPGADGNEAKAKSAMIEDIAAVPNPNASNGVPSHSLLIQTSHRPIKLTAPTVEKHELWMEAISHLLTRKDNGGSLGLLNDTNNKKMEPHNTTAGRSLASTRGSSGRPSFRRINDIFQQASSGATNNSSPSIVTDEVSDDDDVLEDVRMCCNGKHHVSHLEKDHAHRPQYRKQKSRASGIITASTS